MHARHGFVSLLVSAANVRNAMLVASSRKPGIAPPSVGMDCRTRFHSLSNEAKQAFCRDILDVLQPDTPDSSTIFLCRNHHDGFFLDFTTPLSFFRASNVGFVDLNLAGKEIAARSYHSPAQLVHPCPGRFIAAQAQHPLQAQGTYAILLAGYEPHRKKPRPKGLTGVLRHRASRQRRFAVACPASKHTALHYPRLLNNPAVAAEKPVRPAQATDIVATPGLCTEPVIHFVERAQVINTWDRLGIFHDKKISAIFTGVKGIPILMIITAI